MVTVGLDLHKRYITACALDDAGTVLAEHRRLEPSFDALGRWLWALPQPLTVALEATLYWHWLERQLTALGMHVVVAHPYPVKLIWQARTRTDPRQRDRQQSSAPHAGRTAIEVVGLTYVAAGGGAEDRHRLGGTIEVRAESVTMPPRLVHETRLRFSRAV
jgi:hypothetical protein